MSESGGWANVSGILRRQRIHGILIPGFIDLRRRPYEFSAMYNSVYMKADDGYIELTAILGGDQLRLRVVDTISHEPSVTEDSEVAATVADVSNLYFGEDGGAFCVEALIYLTRRSNIDDGIVSCLELAFGDGSRILFDPLWIFGVRLTMVGAKRPWMQRRERYLGPVQVMTWRPADVDTELGDI